MSYFKDVQLEATRDRPMNDEKAKRLNEIMKKEIPQFITMSNKNIVMPVW